MYKPSEYTLFAIQVICSILIIFTIFVASIIHATNSLSKDKNKVMDTTAPAVIVEDEAISLSLMINGKEVELSKNIPEGIINPQSPKGYVPQHIQVVGVQINRADNSITFWNPAANL